MNSDSLVSICLLFPDLLGTYGDGGNAKVLEQRLVWRGIAAEIVEVSLGSPVPETCDVYLLGGGEDQPQSSVTTELSESRSLHRAVDAGATVFAVCAGMQILGESFAVAGDKMRNGLGLLDVTTVRGEGSRRVGELVSEPLVEMSKQPLSGYENHGGITRLGKDARPLGKVVSGRGNDDGLGNEGAVTGKVFGTYLHGPALARNAHLADFLLETITGLELAPLDDSEVEALRKERLGYVAKSALSSGRRHRLDPRRLIGH